MIGFGFDILELKKVVTRNVIFLFTFFFSMYLKIFNLFSSIFQVEIRSWLIINSFPIENERESGDSSIIISSNENPRKEFFIFFCFSSLINSLYGNDSDLIKYILLSWIDWIKIE